MRWRFPGSQWTLWTPSSRTVYPGALDLARNLLLAGIGMPDDWAECHGNPVQFMLRTVQQVASGFNRRAIDAVAHTNLALGTAPSPSSWRERAQQNPGGVFVSVEATHISVIYLRDTFELLAKTDPRLPATFYRMLCQAVSR